MVNSWIFTLMGLAYCRFMCHTVYACVCFSFLADLFDILLPMLNIYQEFVRNHQYSLQVLANCKQNRDFDKLLKQYESNAACEGRMLETFLTYPMFQVFHGNLQTLLFTKIPLHMLMIMSTLASIYCLHVSCLS